MRPGGSVRRTPHPGCRRHPTVRLTLSAYPASASPLAVDTPAQCGSGAGTDRRRRMSNGRRSARSRRESGTRRHRTTSPLPPLPPIPSRRRCIRSLRSRAVRLTVPRLVSAARSSSDRASRSLRSMISAPFEPPIRPTRRASSRRRALPARPLLGRCRGHSSARPARPAPPDRAA